MPDGGERQSAGAGCAAKEGETGRTLLGLQNPLQLECANRAEFGTRRLILHAHDELERAQSTGVWYESPLAASPADPKVLSSPDADGVDSKAGYIEQLWRQLPVPSPLRSNKPSAPSSTSSTSHASGRIDVRRDQTDNMLLEAALAGQVDAVVSGDNDPVTLNLSEGIPIVSLTAFLKMLQSQRHT